MTVDVLIPTFERLPALIMTLSGVAGQARTDLRLIVADQSREPQREHPVIQTLCRIIEARGGAVEWHHRPAASGIADQRRFLLSQAAAPSVLFVDDDVYMEPWVVERLEVTLRAEKCGFVGAYPVGLSYRDDVRPYQQTVEFWEGPVRPEVVEPGSAAWNRAPIHFAANLYHVSRRLDPGEFRRYKVAWVGACAIYDREKLLAVGGYDFATQLPRYHSGEDVVVQNLLLRRFGGCALMPSGTYHAEVPTTILNDAGAIDRHALELLPELVARYAPDPDVESAGGG